MPELIPFPGLRYAAAPDLSRLAAPPYDVIDDAQRDRLEALDPHNAVRLILPRDRTDDDRYTAAATTLRTWVSDGTLRRDPDPTFTLVRMCTSDAEGREHTMTGVIGALRLPRADGHANTEDAEGGEGILPHERTLPKAKSDRLALLSATRANLDPIWGLSLRRGLTELLLPDGAPDAWCRDDQGCTHEAWSVADPERLAAIRAAVAEAPVVLADGHHRFETARRYLEEHPNDPGAHAVMALVVELTEDQLDIRPIHRLVRLSPGLDVRAALADAFEIVDLARDASAREITSALDARGAMALVTSESTSLLIPREGTRATTEAEWPGEVAGTDAAVVESVVRPRLGSTEWEYRAGTASVVEAVRSGTADAALVLRPVSVGVTRSVAAAHARMPQKTTFFHPKPRTGMVFRTLD